MSSHHIVREKQEPALLLMSLRGCEPELLGQLLEWSPTVLVNGSEYEAADSLGIKIDGVVMNEESLQTLQPGTFVINAGDRALEDAMKFLCGEQYPAVNVIDETFCIKDYALFADRIDLVVLIPGRRIFVVRSGFSKWKAAGERIDILSEVRNLHAGGLRKVKDHSYVTEKEGFYTLSFEQPFIFIAEEL